MLARIAFHMGYLGNCFNELDCLGVELRRSLRVECPGVGSRLVPRTFCADAWNSAAALELQRLVGLRPLGLELLQDLEATRA